jgi:hypothetical protein
LADAGQLSYTGKTLRRRALTKKQSVAANVTGHYPMKQFAVNYFR